MNIRWSIDVDGADLSELSSDVLEVIADEIYNGNDSGEIDTQELADCQHAGYQLQAYKDGER